MSEFDGLWKHTQKKTACTVGWVARLHHSWRLHHFLGEGNLNFPWKKSHWDNTVVKSEVKADLHLSGEQFIKLFPPLIFTLQGKSHTHRNTAGLWVNTDKSSSFFFFSSFFLLFFNPPAVLTFFLSDLCPKKHHTYVPLRHHYPTLSPCHTLSSCPV